MLQRAVHEAMGAGVKALPIVALITFFVGIIIALQGAYQLQRIGAMQLVPSLVAISPAVPASAAQAQVEALLSHYFHGINTHNYQEYASTLNAAQLAKQPQSQFESGYSSTTDSGMTLTSLSDSGNGGLTATVAFTSRQSPSQSVDKSSCNAWTLNLYLVPQGSGYLIGPAPAGYQPNYSDC